MSNDVIIHTLAQKVTDTIYDEWHHDGHIEVEHFSDFSFTLDGRCYQVILKDCGKVPPGYMT